VTEEVPSPTRIAVLGLGKMGLPLAVVFANAGYVVTGIDTDGEKVARINAGESPYPEEPHLDSMLKSALKKKFAARTEPVKADIHIILIPIMLKNGKADLSILEDVCRKIAGVIKRGDTIVLESTAPPGTCSTVVVPLLETTGLKAGVDFGVGHCPERTMSGTALDDIMHKYPKIIGASDPRTEKVLTRVYSSINTKGCILMRNTQTAEAVKVFEGIYRDVNIALANELALFCEEKGIDVTEVIKAANTQPYCHLHDPGAGVGGHCIPVYPYFVMSEKTCLIQTARKINEVMPYHVVDLLQDMFEKKGIHLKGAKVLLLGISFRGGVKEERFSPFFAVRDELIRRGALVYGYDPLYTREEVERLGVTYSTDYRVDGIILLTDHSEFGQIDWNHLYRKRVQFVVDGRNILDREKVESAGLWYAGVGRRLTRSPQSRSR
jgi:UDP-N-acetyl-D-mannosaminuronic acid dehydrogenase